MLNLFKGRAIRNVMGVGVRWGKKNKKKKSRKKIFVEGDLTFEVKCQGII